MNKILIAFIIGILALVVSIVAVWISMVLIDYNDPRHHDEAYFNPVNIGATKERLTLVQSMCDGTIELIPQTIFHNDTHKFSSNNCEWKLYSTILPYTQNHSIVYNSEGQIDYNAVIKKIMPGMWEDELDEQGIIVDTDVMYYGHGPQLSIYQERSSLCGYVIDHKDEVHWLSGGINKFNYTYSISKQFPGECRPNLSSCWCDVHTKYLEEIRDFEDIPLSIDEEKIVSDFVFNYLKDNPNLNFYDFKIGKYHNDYGNEDLIPFCGQFRNYKFFEGSIDTVTNEHDFSLERSLSPLCVISDDAKYYSFDENSKQ